MYLLKIDIEARSICDNQDCIDWRLVLDQTHLRFVLRPLTGTESARLMKKNILAISGLLETCYICSANGAAIFRVARGGAPMMRGSVAATMLDVATDLTNGGGANLGGVDVPEEVVVEAYQVGCLCLSACLRCIANRFTTTTTTTTTLPTTITTMTTTTTTATTTSGVATIAQREQFEKFITTTMEGIDELAFQVGVTSARTDVDLESSMKALQANFMAKFTAILRGLSVTTTGDVAAVQDILFEINDQFTSHVTAAEWPALRKKIMKSISNFRSELYKIRLAFV
jgi:hypothetical protein